jgi:hypothetical protein
MLAVQLFLIQSKPVMEWFSKVSFNELLYSSGAAFVLFQNVTLVSSVFLKLKDTDGTPVHLTEITE